MKTVLLFVSCSMCVLGVAACQGGSLGDRCNPKLSHNDCDDGLVCVEPSTCVESYCCPANGAASDNPFCNGAACPAPTPDASAPDEAGAADAAPE